jgi:hypothetical protein
MTTNKPGSSLQESYKAMVEAIEEFVVKEGKTLQQAFVAAEQKLHDAKEISQEKIAQASDDLKNNLSVLSEAIEGASEAYKDNILFDVAYINATVWNKLQSIANSNTVELMAFTKNLQDSANAATTEEHLTAHHEHSDWASEHDFWLDEVALWKKDHDLALNKLALIEKAIKDHASELNKHVSAIQNHAKADHQHEETMANVEHDQTSKVFKDADNRNEPSHDKQRSAHAKQSEVHRKLKTSHIKTMAMINTLYKETQKVN